MINSILSRLRIGSSGADVRDRYGPFHHVPQSIYAMAKGGRLGSCFARDRQFFQWRHHHDRQFLCRRSSACGYMKKEDRDDGCMGHSRGGLTTKIHAIGHAGRFQQPRNAGVYFDPVPRRHQSGELDWIGRITKQDNSTVRNLLYEPANSILNRSRGSFALKI